MTHSFPTRRSSDLRFELGNGGHYVKSRAAKAEIRDNSFDDTGGRETNYMIDLPEGATGLITANQMVQGKNKEYYSAFIALAAEGKRSEEHTSELQSLMRISYSVFCLKKKQE